MSIAALNASVSDIEEPSKLGNLGYCRRGALARPPLCGAGLDQFGLERSNCLLSPIRPCALLIFPSLSALGPLVRNL